MRVLDLKKIAIFLLVLVSGNNLFAMELSKSKRSNPIAEQYMIKSENVFQAYPDSGRYYAKKSLSYSENSLDSAYAFQQLGRSFVELGFIDSGFVCLNNARKIFQEIDFDSGLIKIYTDLGQTFSRNGYYEKSKEYYQQALSIKSLELNEDIVLRDIYYHLGIVESVLGQYKESFKYFEKILEFYKVNKHDTRYSNTVLEYAKVLTNSGRYKNSSDILLTGVQTNHIEFQDDVFSQLAMNYYYQNNLDSAVYYSLQELKYCGTPADSLECLSNLSAYYILLERYIDADSCFKLSESKMLNSATKIQLQMNQIELFCLTNRNEQAVSLFEEVSKIVIDSNMTIYFPNLLEAKSFLLSQGLEFSFDTDKLCRKLIQIDCNESKHEKKFSNDFINTISKADREIEIKNKEIEVERRYNIILTTLSLLLICSLVIAVYKHYKLKLYLSSLKDSYSIVSDKINNDMRMLLQKLLSVEEEIGSVFSIRKRLEMDILPLLEDIKSLLEVLSKQLFKHNKSKEKRHGNNN